VVVVGAVGSGLLALSACSSAEHPGAVRESRAGGRRLTGGADSPPEHRLSPVQRVGARCHDDRVTGCRITDFFALVDQLPDVTRLDSGRYWRVCVADRTFGYLWEPTCTVGLKQTISEQLALVAERPETFETQFTSGGFGWVVVRLGGVEREELAELTFEAWRLTAPAALVDRRGDRLPR
jgi:hypothetical protein